MACRCRVYLQDHLKVRLGVEWWTHAMSQSRKGNCWEGVPAGPRVTGEAATLASITLVPEWSAPGAVAVTRPDSSSCPPAASVSVPPGPRGHLSRSEDPQQAGLKGRGCGLHRVRTGTSPVVRVLPFLLLCVLPGSGEVSI
jgi:hypothetical protein